MNTPALPATPLPPTVPAAANSLSFQGLNQLQAAAKADPRNPQAIKAVAQQFEALLMQQMLTAMNATSLGPDLLGDTSGPMFKSLFTQQIATTISQGQGIGLASYLAKELATRYGATPQAKSGAAPGGASAAPNPAARHQASWPVPPRDAAFAAAALGPQGRPSASAAAEPGTASVQAHTAQTSFADKAQAFIESILPSVRSAAAALGVSPVAILAQAALETGWGSHAPGNNLFGIKAGGNWQGASLSGLTQEFAGGVAQMGEAAFRAYQSAADSVQNYAQMMLGSPRYQSVRGHGGDIAGFASALQHSGYATDPDYARKLLAVAQSPTMRQALAAVDLSAGSSLAMP
ncbi:peptidoglycan hydrolase FlgJ [mine drainage metagenome]|uniref:Peptidoglycan hydrolase FlgJ n=1 Tax=mine drainage metagenome TaxID=410659 RepID=A0A1J5R196_9ZZZZ